MSSAAVNAALGTEVLAVQRLFDNITPNPGASISRYVHNSLISSVISFACKSTLWRTEMIGMTSYCNKVIFVGVGTVYDQLLILNDKFEVDKTFLEQQGLVRSCSYHIYTPIDSFVAVLRGNMGDPTSRNEFEPRRHEKGLELDFTFWNQADLPGFQLAILEKRRYA
jgi:hypothetical protein